MPCRAQTPGPGFVSSRSLYLPSAYRAHHVSLAILASIQIHQLPHYWLFFHQYLRHSVLLQARTVILTGESRWKCSIVVISRIRRFPYPATHQKIINFGGCLGNSGVLGILEITIIRSLITDIGLIFSIL